MTELTLPDVVRAECLVEMERLRVSCRAGGGLSLDLLLRY